MAFRDTVGPDGECVRRARPRRRGADAGGVARFASAFGAYIRSARQGAAAQVVLGRDSRTSGPMFSRIVAGALQSVGCDVVEIGIAPTPTALYNIRALGGRRIVVTASHNPVEWNALKLASGRACSWTRTRRRSCARSSTTGPSSGRRGMRWATSSPTTTPCNATSRPSSRVPYLDIEGLRRGGSGRRSTASAAPAPCCCRGCSRSSAAR
jgi:hypothetical protein